MVRRAGRDRRGSITYEQVQPLVGAYEAISNVVNNSTNHNVQSLQWPTCSIPSFIRSFSHSPLFGAGARPVAGNRFTGKQCRQNSIINDGLQTCGPSHATEHVYRPIGYLCCALSSLIPASPFLPPLPSHSPPVPLPPPFSSILLPPHPSYSAI